MCQTNSAATAHADGNSPKMIFEVLWCIDLQYSSPAAFVVGHRCRIWLVAVHERSEHLQLRKRASHSVTVKDWKFKLGANDQGFQTVHASDFATHDRYNVCFANLFVSTFSPFRVIVNINHSVLLLYFDAIFVAWLTLSLLPTSPNPAATAISVAVTTRPSVFDDSANTSDSETIRNPALCGPTFICSLPLTTAFLTSTTKTDADDVRHTEISSDTANFNLGRGFSREPILQNTNICACATDIAYQCFFQTSQTTDFQTRSISDGSLSRRMS
ncbi:LOW QUALITY PROTEIN: hypothetical protein MAR_027040 [Mya arenaria]|uniref:Uncharacterized protein n=1 Tax=Mya arenaria TaxID=6604 RepID=A0ABY7ES93_MYAAR|nr:LOW QUALITY PROTEIN: hypothetical protein MAR_027040 [Mya arenaria]